MRSTTSPTASSFSAVMSRDTLPWARPCVMESVAVSRSRPPMEAVPRACTLKSRTTKPASASVPGASACSGRSCICTRVSERIR